jgi:hypothetical protein
MKTPFPHFVRQAFRVGCLAVLALFLTTAALHAQDDSPQGPERGGGMFGGDMAAHSVRGTVTAVSGNEISVKSEEGDVFRVETGPNTHFRKQRQEISASDIHAGDMVMAIGDKDDKAKTLGAIFVVVIDKEQYEKARADFGKTWTTGKVVSMKDLTLTIERPDKVTQTITVDENTSFRRRREDITLADIKVGDNVTARGALQNGSFLATVLAVMEPGQGRGGRGFGGGMGQGAGQGQGSNSGSSGQGSNPPQAAQPQNQ